ncbi:BnaA03g01880D [Brassica napus]|uniref:Sulfotransferase n=1 Tax=Brassica napus TaxID=3708 RepID=A0A078FED3_BRANA|nr:cytosolic sulfotransferase 1-like [Brassica napus]CAF2118675.1 unnamed protein product [Brassica napus]CDY11352.1 BnaA03g01880D [Brassica napus]
MDHKELPATVREDYISEETKKLISSLPVNKDSQGNLCKYQGCWYYYNTLQGAINFQNHFQPQDTDVILASFPKSGTTWLKALTVALLERSKHHDDHPLNHPLLSDNPHAIVPFLETKLYLRTSTPDLTKYSSSPSSSARVFATHMPLHTVKEGLRGSPCKIVYMCRNAKDVLISLWYFKCKYQKLEVTRSVLESTFESFCGGGNFYGPFWDHVLSYWRGSLEDDPSRVLFMKYEEMKEEPCVQLKRLAEFLGVPFTEEEEESGCVEKILELCSLRSLSDLAINKIGKTSSGPDYKLCFRKGEVGDSKNYLTPEMEMRIDMIIEENLKGSGLSF